MKEQETYKKVLEEVINATESNKIKTTDEVIQTLIFELTNQSVNFSQKAHS